MNDLHRDAMPCHARFLLFGFGIIYIYIYSYISILVREFYLLFGVVVIRMQETSRGFNNLLRAGCFDCFRFVEGSGRHCHPFLGGVWFSLFFSLSLKCFFFLSETVTQMLISCLKIRLVYLKFSPCLIIKGCLLYI